MYPVHAEENPETEGVDAPDAALKSDTLVEQEEGEEVQKARRRCRLNTSP